MFFWESSVPGFPFIVSFFSFGCLRRIVGGLALLKFLSVSISIRFDDDHAGLRYPREK